MAGTTTTKSTTDNKSTDSILKFDVETEVTTARRGRAPSAEGEAIRAELQKCMADRTVRSFSNVTKAEREVWARKIRAAGEKEGIEVQTRFDEDAKKLVWGPSEVMNELAAKSKSAE